MTRAVVMPYNLEQQTNGQEITISAEFGGTLELQLVGTGNPFNVYLNGQLWGAGQGGASLTAGEAANFDFQVIDRDRIKITGATVFRAVISTHKLVVL